MDIDDISFNNFYREDKIVDTDVEWVLDGNRYTIKNIEILNETLDKKVTLHCWVNRYKKFGFTIVYNGEKDIVRYDKAVHPPGYKNRCSDSKEGRVQEPHKHKFKEGCPKSLRIKIIPKDEINPDDVNEAFFQFLNECNIRHEGEYIPVFENPMDEQQKLYRYVEKITNHLKQDNNNG